MANVTLTAGNDSYFVFDGFLGGTTSNSANASVKNSTVDGNAGFDTLFFGDSGWPTSHFNISVATTGVVTLTASSGSITFTNFEKFQFQNNVQLLIGSAANDALTGSTGSDPGLYGFDGNDTLTGSNGGNDTLLGGAGNDTYVIDSTSDSVRETTTLSGATDAGGIDTVQTAVTYTLGTAGNIENLTLTGAAAVNGTGNALDNALTGNGAANSLNGSTGNDTLDGGAGNDTLIGGAGNDTYVVDAGDSVQEATTAGGATDAGGTDTVQSAASFTLGSFLENLTLTGAAAVNGTGNALANALVGNGGNNVLSGVDGNDSIDGAGGTDTLDGGIGNDALTGGAGADSLVGGTGNDTLLGGADNDTYLVDSTLDVVQESTVLNGTTDAGGTDLVQSSVNVTLGSFVENLTLTGTGALRGTGNASANTILGNSGANVLGASGGNDSVGGGAGNDTLDGGTGNDTLLGGAGNDTYTVNSVNDRVDEATTFGGATDAGGRDLVKSSVAWTLDTTNRIENLTLTGNAAVNGTGNSAVNTLTGNNGANLLSGLQGNDILRGGLGNDTLTGGGGMDTFTFNTALDATGNLDTISDYGTLGRADRIYLDDDIFSALGPVTGNTALGADAFALGTAATTASQHIIYDQTSGALYYDADGVGGVAQVQFATLSNHAALTEADFFITT